MPFITGEVVPNSAGSHPFKVVFKHDGTLLEEWGVQSVAEGEQQIVETLRELRKKAEEDGDT